MMNNIKNSCKDVEKVITFSIGDIAIYRQKSYKAEFQSASRISLTIELSRLI